MCLRQSCVTPLVGFGDRRHAWPAIRGVILSVWYIGHSTGLPNGFARMVTGASRQAPRPLKPENPCAGKFQWVSAAVPMEIKPVYVNVVWISPGRGHVTSSARNE